MSITSSPDQRFLESIHESVIAPALDYLAPYQGQEAQIWFYTHSHGQIHIRVGNEPDDCVYLIADMCQSVQGLFQWESCALTIAVQGTMQAFSCIIADEQAGFELRCKQAVIRVVPWDKQGFQPGRFC